MNKYTQTRPQVGVFYATHMRLGGRINKSYTMLATQKDTEDSVKGELEVSYGKGCFGVTGQSSTEVVNGSSSTNREMKTDWRAQGGETQLWLAYNFKTDNAEEVAKTWAATVNESNAFPISCTLQPIWKLVKEVDAKKGDELEKYLLEKWSRSASEFNPTNFLVNVIEPMISEHPRWKCMMKRAQGHIEWCRYQQSDAERWIDAPSGFNNQKRNMNWREAAIEGQTVCYMYYHYQ